ncbi:MAG: hypothetical protein J6K17_00240 [Oscillospiraceae bacterium]|nr:hypothetical protein [Oscillospiraceae bacterium]
MAEFNTFANPKVETKRFKIYLDVGTEKTPEWELQGRGIESWTIEENSDVEKVTDVLGTIDMERSVGQPTQSGVNIKIRKGSKLGQMLFDAWFKRDYTSLNALKILQKFEFVDGTTEGSCLARLEEDVMIAINNFTGEAGGYLGFEVDIHYANKTTTGTMPKVDGESITFTPDSAA